MPQQSQTEPALLEPQIILTRGVPASGKSTKAHKWVSEDPNWRVRLNRDDLRFMIANKYWPLTFEQENTVTRIQMSSARAAIKAGQSVIIDDTNLRAKNVVSWLELGVQLGVPVTNMDVWVDLGEAILRDSNRERRVGEEVIRKFYRNFMQKDCFPVWPTLDVTVPQGRAYVPDVNLPKAYLVDIDGTLADMSVCGRGPFDWHRVEEDELVTNVSDVVASLRASGYKIVMMSGRDEAARAGTVRWLAKNGVQYDDLFMRAKGDMRKDNVVKEELFYNFVAPKYFVQAAIDDRQQVVDHYRKVMGIFTYQCNYGNF